MSLDRTQKRGQSVDTGGNVIGAVRETRKQILRDLTRCSLLSSCSFIDLAKYPAPLANLRLFIFSFI